MAFYIFYFDFQRHLKGNKYTHFLRNKNEKHNPQDEGYLFTGVGQ